MYTHKYININEGDNKKNKNKKNNERNKQNKIKHTYHSNHTPNQNILTVCKMAIKQINHSQPQFTSQQ